jgi:crossover junction endodeoxyribonuclease RuvC
MVTRLLRMTSPPRPADAADALALAICHLWRAPALKAGPPAVKISPPTVTAGPVVGGTQ